MHSATHLGLAQWLPTHATLVTTAAVWATGFAIAGASAWRIHQENAAIYSTTDSTTESTDWAVAAPAAAPSEEPVDTAEAEGIVYMPMDVIVGHRAPGVVSMQKP